MQVGQSNLASHQIRRDQLAVQLVNRTAAVDQFDSFCDRILAQQDQQMSGVIEDELENMPSTIQHQRSN